MARWRAEALFRLPELPQDMPRWFRYSEVAQSRDVFSYLIGFYAGLFIAYLLYLRRYFKAQPNPTPSA